MRTPKLSRVVLEALGLFVLVAPLHAAPARPNILFAIADDASYPHMGAYGCSWVTSPGFDRVAREGLLFTRAYTPNAKCAPSRACIITGRNPWQLGAACNHVPHFPSDQRSFVEVLAERGYRAAYTAKGWAPGEARDAAGERRQLTGENYNRRQAPPPTRGISSNDYAANFADFLDATPAGTPWFFWYGSVEPHRGYEYGSGIAKGGKKTSDIDVVPPFWPDTEVVRTDMLDYAFEIEHFDRHLVRMLELIEDRGELERTLVVVTADNGMPFPRVKGQEYELSNHLPLAIRWPEGIASPGRVIDDHVSFIDFAPTFLEAAGVDWSEGGMAPTPGRSLSDIFRSERAGRVIPERDHVVIGKERHDIGRPLDAGYPIRGIVKDGFLFLRNYETGRWPAGNPETGYLNCDGSPTKTVILETRGVPDRRRYWEMSFGKRPAVEFFEVGGDPFCIANLTLRPEHAAKQAELESILLRRLEAEGDPRARGEGHVFDAYPYADEARRGFYEKFTAGEQPRAGWVNPGDFDSRELEPLP